jgi:hypothetical protein
LRDRYPGKLMREHQDASTGYVHTGGGWLSLLRFSRDVATHIAAQLCAAITLLLALLDGRDTIFGGPVVTIVLVSYILGKRVAHERLAHD